MPEKRVINLPWSEKKWTSEEQREVDEYEKTHTYHPEFYAEYEKKEEEDKDNK
ncbi:MAG: hypothetical protein RSC93_07825 [Erysipelotrichaceae bacterium]